MPVSTGVGTSRPPSRATTQRPRPSESEPPRSALLRAAAARFIEPADRRAQFLRVEAEDTGRRVDVPRGAQCHHRQRQHGVAPRDVEHHVHVHARAQQAVLVRDVDEHREHRDVLVDDGLRLDLLDRAPERPARVGGDLDARRHAGGELADVGFIHAHPGAHARQVRHRQEQRAAADVLGRRRDHLAAFHEPREDGAVGRRAHLGVLPRDARILQLDAGGNGLRPRVGHLEFEGLELGLVDPGVAAQLLAARELRLGRGEALAGRR